MPSRIATGMMSMIQRQHAGQPRRVGLFGQSPTGRRAAVSAAGGEAEAGIRLAEAAGTRRAAGAEEAAAGNSQEVVAVARSLAPSR